MTKSIAVFGAGPGLGQAVAHRYAQEGYDVVLVARRREPLELLARDVAAAGVRAHVVTADLAATDAIPGVAEQVCAATGDLDAFYYAPTPTEGFVPAAGLTPQRVQDFMPLIVYSLLALVQQFLPHMVEARSGAILTAQGASTVHGLPNLSGPGPAQAAQRNYLQSLHAEMADKGVYVGMLYIGAIIENSGFHTDVEKAKAAGAGRDWAPRSTPPTSLTCSGRCTATRARRRPSTRSAKSVIEGHRLSSTSGRMDDFGFWVAPPAELRGLCRAPGRLRRPYRGRNSASRALPRGRRRQQGGAERQRAGRRPLRGDVRMIAIGAQKSP